MPARVSTKPPSKPNSEQIGPLTVLGDLTLNGTLKIELDGTGGDAADLLIVGNQLDIRNGTVLFEPLNLLDDPAYVFASYGTLLGDRFLNEDNLPPGYHIDYNFGGLNQIALVPEPAAAPVFLFALAAWIAATRRTRKRA